MSLAKVTFIKWSVTIRRCGVCGGVAACCIESVKRNFSHKQVHFIVTVSYMWL